MDIRIIDDFLDIKWADEFEGIVSTQPLAWQLLDATADLRIEFTCADTIDTPQLAAMLMYDNEIASQPAIPFIFAGAFSAKTQLSSHDIIRCKVNVTSPVLGYPLHAHYQPHTDVTLAPGEQAVTAIYYINECDGDTVFFKRGRSGVEEEMRVAPRRNRLVYFDSETIHAGSPPTTGLRYVLNANFKTAFK